ncbi:lipid-A-disaccharide synthase [Candidatus Fermentibacterales bacterium]|nr:lipid-A-disaccharide synthase [Candidatus Fermentibacterales bacterium]
MSRLFVCAGEPSGDARAAELIRELGAVRDIEVMGFGGPELESSGARLVDRMSGYAVMGFWEVLAGLPALVRLYRRLRRSIIEWAPDALVLVDYPGMNLRLARWASRRGIPVVYYVSPQIWAWGSGRVRSVARHVTLMLTLFRFEKDFYDSHGAKAVWVGHPIVDALREQSWPPSEEPVPQRLAILPGSRAQEVRRNLPVMLDALRILLEGGVVSEASLSVHTGLDPALYDSAGEFPCLTRTFSVPDALRGASAAAVCSGTATLETALRGVPLVVVYRTSPVTYLLARLLVRGVRQIALANLVTGSASIPELIQGKATGPAIALALEQLIRSDVQERSTLASKLAGVREALGPPGAAARAAAEVDRLLGASGDA